MRLDRVIGMHPKYQSGKIFYNRDAKLSREFLYTQANLLLAYYPPNQKQRLFYDHKTSNIEFFYLHNNLAFTVSRTENSGGQSNPNSLAKDFEVAIWDVNDAR